MKKLVSFLLALALTVPVVGGIAACDNNDTPVAADNALRVTTEPVRTLKVGEDEEIAYRAKVDGKVVDSKDMAVKFASSDPKVVTVDEYGNVKAVGVGTATVTVTLKNDESYSGKVRYTVTKSFFMNSAGYINGDVDTSTAELDGWIRIPAGNEVQVLVSECAEDWYFKTTIEHSGDTGANSVGRWGVGSFLVDSANAIGNTMMWLGFKPTDHVVKSYTPYVGGWRVLSGGNDPEIEIGEVMENANIAEMEIIRHGADHYCTITVGSQVAKYTYTCPSLEGKATYPGVYSQRQEIYVSDYDVSVDPEVVNEKLNNFQVAEEVKIEGVSDKLFAGETYSLKATVAPETTYDKSVTFTLKQPVEGVSITPAGTLTVAEGVTGEVTVVATATSGENVYVEKTYTVAVRSQSAHNVFDTTAIVGDSEKYTLGAEESENSITYAAESGKTYVPLNVPAGDKWALGIRTNLTAGTAGLYSVTSGMTDYVGTELLANKLVYGAMNKEDEIACNSAAENNMILIRDGSFYYIVVNDRLVDKFYSATGVDTIPVIYTNGAVGTIDNVGAITDSDAVDAIIAHYPHTVGKYVTVNGTGDDTTYTLAPMTFQGDGDVNWPPVNNYENGLKFANTVKGDFTMEFYMTDIVPLKVGGKTDAKVLIYLRSESKTASLQFVFKDDPDNAGQVKIAFCPNLNDATWTEYDCPLDLFRDDPVYFKIVKTGEEIVVYIDGATAYYSGSNGNGIVKNPGLDNLGYWTDDTEFTPGLGSFNCGVTFSGVKLTAGTGETQTPDTAENA